MLYLFCLWKSVDNKINEILKFAPPNVGSLDQFIQVLKFMCNRGLKGFDDAYKSFTKLRAYEQAAFFCEQPLDYEKTIDKFLKYV